MLIPPSHLHTAHSSAAAAHGDEPGQRHANELHAAAHADDIRAWASVHPSDSAAGLWASPPSTTMSRGWFFQ